MSTLQPFAAKTPAQSRVEMTELVMPAQTNVPGFLFGGVVLSWMDIAGGVAALRHSGGPAVTASIDRVDFLAPIRLGDIVVLRAQVELVGRTSMEIAVEVTTEDPRTGEERLTTSAFLTFVGVDAEGKPRRVPPLTPETEEERVRAKAAEARRNARLAAASEKMGRL